MPLTPLAHRNSVSRQVGPPSINPVDKVVAQSLMIPLMMIVVDEFGERSSEVPLAKRNHPIETFLFDRSHEAFRVRIRIRRPERCLHDLNAGLVEQPLHLPTPFPIPIADQYAVVAQQPDLGGCQRSTHLAHE
jgi:hypothetical protein